MVGNEETNSSQLLLLHTVCCAAIYKNLEAGEVVKV
jgi:hypothetical protein